MTPTDDQIGPPHSSQVHTHELNGTESIDADRGHAMSAYEAFRHGAWTGLRALTYSALAAAKQPETTLRRFRNCGTCCEVSYSPSQKRLFLSSSNCKNRHCQPCANARRATISANLTRFCDRKHLRLMTLTLKHYEHKLGDQLTRLNTCFKLLRRRDDWQSHIAGYAAFTEVKWSERSSQWHVHVHILCEGTWWDKHELSYAWHTVTGDSMIVDIREVTSNEGVTYTAKYASKPFSLADIPAVERVTAITEIGRRRLWHVGGTWKGKIDLTATEPLPGDVEVLGWFGDIVDEARRGDESAAAILAAIVGDDAAACTHRDADDFDGS